MTSLDRRAAFPNERSQFPWWASVACVILFLFTIFSVWQSRKSLRQLANAQTRLAKQTLAHSSLEAEKALAERARKIISHPASVYFPLRAKSAPALHVFWNDQLGILIYGVDVPIPAEGHAFKLLLLPVKGSVQPFVAATFRPDSSGNVTLVLPVPRAPLHSIAALVVSEDAAPANTEPASAPVWLGSVPR